MVILLKKIFLFVFICIPFLFTKSSYSYNSKSYVVYDCNTQSVIMGDNINEVSLIASTTKILTCIVALENADIYKKILITKEDTLIEGSKVYVCEGETYTLLDLLYGLMLRSGNDCANAIARCAVDDYDKFIYLMNEKCKELGMKNSSFENPSGLDNENENRSTAYEMALLMSYSMNNEYFKEIASSHDKYISSLEGKKYYLKNKDKSVLNDERFIAGKTGYTKKSGRILVNYASAYSRNVVIVTINDSNDWQNHQKYLNSLEKYVDYNIISQGQYQISGQNIYIEVPKDIKIPILKTESDKYTYILDINNNYLEIYYNGLFICKYSVKIMIFDT